MHRIESFWQPIRTAVWPFLHKPLKAVGGFSVTDVEREQYVGTVDEDQSEFEEVLCHEVGFDWNPIASAKFRDDGWSKGTWVYRDSENPIYWADEPRPDWPDILTDYQLHVTLYPAKHGSGTDIYAHYERSYVRHPIQHVNGHEYSGFRGVRMARTLLHQHDIDYTLP